MRESLGKILLTTMGEWGLTDKGIHLICKLMHPDGREDCACLYLTLPFTLRCTWCDCKPICPPDIERGSIACNYIRYHGMRPEDIRKSHGAKT